MLKSLIAQSLSTIKTLLWLINMTLNNFIIQDYGYLVGFYPTDSQGREWWQNKTKDIKHKKLGSIYLVDRLVSRDIISGIERDLED